jgi:hypothetical protein
VLRFLAVHRQWTRPRYSQIAMPENENVDHWGHLVSELGAKPAPEEPKAADEQMPPPPVADAPAPRRKTPAAPRPTRPPKSSGDWNRLAETLGVDVPPEELPAPPPPPKAREPVVAREMTPPEVAPPASPPARREPDRERGRGGEGRGRESRREDRGRGGESRERTGDRESRGEDRGGRKRRRRRRRPGEEGEGAPRRNVEPQAIRPAAEESQERDEAQEPSAATGSEAPARPRTADDQPPRGGDRRRRRRRGGGSRPDSRPERPAHDVDELEPESKPVPVDVPDEDLDAIDEEDLDVIGESMETTDEAAESEDDSESGLRSEKGLHRAIPSWGEAVNVIISANMESRAKNPDRRPSSRPRGGHDRRGRDSGPDRAK